MISFGAHAIDETKKAVDVFDENVMAHAIACLEEMAIEDYWEWRQETGMEFHECVGGNM